MKRILSFLAILIITYFVDGSAITVKQAYYSTIIGDTIQYVVLLPSDYYQKAASGRRYPVAYQLHCAGCDHLTWINKYNYGFSLSELIDSVNYIIAIPYSRRHNLSWWLDSPVNNNSKFSTFLVNEFKPRIDSLYSTLKDANSTAIFGHSMGGYGALHNAMEYPNVFGVVYAIKSVADITAYPTNWGLPAVLGEQSKNIENWKKFDLLQNASKLKNKNLRIKFYSGPKDYLVPPSFVEGNRKLHRILDSLNIPHEYFEDSLESHTDIPLSRAKQVLDFFDSTLVGTTTRVKRQGKTTGPQFKNGQFNVGYTLLHPIVTVRNSVYSVQGRAVDKKEFLSAAVFIF